jgi:hypothetical protein
MEQHQFEGQKIATADATVIRNNYYNILFYRLQHSFLPDCKFQSKRVIVYFLKCYMLSYCTNIPGAMVLLTFTEPSAIMLLTKSFLNFTQPAKLPDA